ncbi:hypothetical protein [Jatrophihabitans fulvus]
MPARHTPAPAAADAIYRLLDEVQASIGSVEHGDVRRWLDLDEPELALDVLSDALDAAAVELTPDQWERWGAAAGALDLTMDDYDFLAPP